MKVVHLNSDGDPAGASFLLHRSLQKIGIDSRHIIPSPKYVHLVQGGTDIIISENKPAALKVIKEADIIHINQDTDFFTNAGFPDAQELLKDKKIVFHNHGGYRLFNPYDQIRRLKLIRKKFPYIVCSPLTKIIIPESVWLPNPIPINDGLYLPVDRNFERTIRCCSKIFSDNTKYYKGTFVVEEAINSFLRDKWNFPIDFKTFKEMKVADVLKMSASCHVCIDNLTQGFIGLAGWESMSKGQAVIARLDPVVEEAYTFLGDGNPPPIINVTGVDEAAKVLRDLCEDREFLKKLCHDSRVWMEEYYAEERITKMFVKLYEEVLEEK